MLKLGIASESELFARMSQDDLVNWFAYYQVEPWGEIQEDRRIGTLIARLKGKGQWFDYFPGFNYENQPKADSNQAVETTSEPMTGAQFAALMGASPEFIAAVSSDQNKVTECQAQ